MPIQIACPCGKSLHVRDELSGKKIKCPACGGVLAVGEQTSAPAKSPPVAAVQSAPPKQPASAAPKTEPPPGQLPSYWECQRDFTHGLLVVTDDALWFNKLADKDLKRAKKSFDEGENPEDVFQDDSTQFQLAYSEMQGINFNKKLAQMEVEYSGKEEKQTTTFYFGDHGLRDEAFKELRRRLGADWKHQRRDLNRFQATFAPLTVLGLLILVFGFFVFLAWAFQQPTEGGGRVVRTTIWGLIVAYTVGWLGPLWTGIIGGVGVVITIAWMVLRIADPPIEITLKRESERLV